MLKDLIVQYKWFISVLQVSINEQSSANCTVSMIIKHIKYAASVPDLKP